MTRKRSTYLHESAAEVVRILDSVKVPRFDTAQIFNISKSSVAAVCELEWIALVGLRDLTGGKPPPRVRQSLMSQIDAALRNSPSPLVDTATERIAKHTAAWDVVADADWTEEQLPSRARIDTRTELLAILRARDPELVDELIEFFRELLAADDPNVNAQLRRIVAPPLLA